MLVNQFLFLAALLFCIGVYGVIARKNAVLVLMSIELILNAVNLNFVAFAHCAMETQTVIRLRCTSLPSRLLKLVWVLVWYCSFSATAEPFHSMTSRR
jgi:multisubunit Na+/H+ antiporter MnhC subunit